MRIESGTTGERRTRVLIFLLMCVVFAAWFAYDGYQRYPAKNLAWARQALPKQPPDLRTNPKVTSGHLEQIKQGTELPAVKVLLGEPALVTDDRYWYVGPAAYAWIDVADGKVQSVDRHLQADPSEGDIRLQKILAGGLLVLSLIVGVKLVQIIRTRAVLDDGGLTFNGRCVPWEAMTALGTGEYAEKGWVDLQYHADGADRSLRLDSYHLNRFDEIVNAICAKKQFESPLRAGQAGAGDEPR